MYKVLEQDLKNYVFLQRGYLGYHKKTKTSLIVFSIQRYRSRFDYRCKILQIEGNEQNLCDVIYSENEVDLTPKLEDFINYYNKVQGEQLTLF